MPESPVDIVPYAHLFDVIDEFIDECRQRNSMFALLLVDINNFRQINLTRGFRAGDLLPGGIESFEVGAICPDETALRIAVGEGALAIADGHAARPSICNASSLSAMPNTMGRPAFLS